MKILVTGGAGFIGSHVVDTYVRAGHQVVVADNLRSGSVAHVPDGVRTHVVDIASREMDAVVELERPDVISHHAAQTSVAVAVRDPALDAYINCYGLLNVLQSSVKHHVRQVVFPSSAGSYGTAKYLPITEDTVLRPESPYGIHKAVGEQYLRFYRREYGLLTTVLRYGNVYGPRQGSHGEGGVVAILSAKLLRREVPTIYAYPDEPRGMSRDYVYVGDVARANLLVTARGADGTFNIAGGRAVRTRELLEEVAAAFHDRDSDIHRAENTSIDAVIKGPRPGDLRDSWLDIAKAQTVLGWEPQTSLAEGIARTLVELRKSVS